MKRKILLWIKQKLCMHQYEFVECDYIGDGILHKPYFLYRCGKCNKSKVIYISSILNRLDEISPIKVLDYPKETLWLPDVYINEIFRNCAIRRESREAGYLVSKYYNKYGILLTAWGNREFEPKVDRDNLEMKSHDEILDGIKRGDGLPPTIGDIQYILSRQEFKQSMEQF